MKEKSKTCEEFVIMNLLDAINENHELEAENQDLLIENHDMREALEYLSTHAKLITYKHMGEPAYSIWFDSISDSDKEDFERVKRLFKLKTEEAEEV